jgi:hypothetical protein
MHAIILRAPFYLDNMKVLFRRREKFVVNFYRDTQVLCPDQRSCNRNKNEPPHPLGMGARYVNCT